MTSTLAYKKEFNNINLCISYVMWKFWYEIYHKIVKLITGNFCSFKFYLRFATNLYKLRISMSGNVYLRFIIIFLNGISHRYFITVQIKRHFMYEFITYGRQLRISISINFIWIESTLLNVSHNRIQIWKLGFTAHTI